MFGDLFQLFCLPPSPPAALPHTPPENRQGVPLVAIQDPTFKTLTNSRKNSDSDFASIFYLPTSPTRKFPAFNQLEISGLPASSKPLPTVSIDENKQK